ncbi:MAG: hypothetical protein DIZ78_13295 [endosymbiont of Escarpia spicata]|uniref:Type VI secretion system tube protein Hcp n=1 Tax=endosymbiont of Escarpia spicata TaxID=2200908 RepID=A0A370DJ68_9GAMM|nr:MAG: hypothetical protein DIZ78_13295 [endosymbiont of Escarpia spicata]
MRPGSGVAAGGLCQFTNVPAGRDSSQTVRKAGGKTPLEYVIVTMKEVIVTSISAGGSGGEDRLTENITLNFAEVKYEYQPQDQKGAKDGGLLKFDFDVAKNDVKK